MKLSDAIVGRRSIRKFHPDQPVDDETVDQILNAAIMAPSAGNAQSWHFVVVRDAAIKHRLATEAGHQHFIDQVPVAIVVCADLDRASKTYGDRGRYTYAMHETGAAIQNMLLTIHSLGLGGCWVGAFDEAMAAEILGLPETFRPVAIIPIGHSAEPANRVPPRRKLGEVTTIK